MKKNKLDAGEEILRGAHGLKVSTPPAVSLEWKNDVMRKIRCEVAAENISERSEDRLAWGLVSSACALAVLLVVGFLFYQSAVMSKTIKAEDLAEDIENSVFADLTSYSTHMEDQT